MKYKYAEELKTTNKDYIKRCIEYELVSLYEIIDNADNAYELAQATMIAGVLEFNLKKLETGALLYKVDEYLKPFERKRIIVLD